MRDTAGRLETRRSGPTEVLGFSGEIDVAAAPALEAAALRCLAAGRAVAIDLTRVSYLDSGGVRLVDRLVQACRREGLPVSVVAPPGGQARNILDICSFPASLLSPSAAEALSVLRSGQA